MRQPDDSKITRASLSPDGKKLTYTIGSHSHAIVDLINGDTNAIQQRCATLWVDEHLLLCEATILIDTRDYSKITVKLVDAQPDSIQLILEQAEFIYQLTGEDWPDAAPYLVRSSNQGYSYIPALPEDFRLPETIPSLTVPSSRALFREPVPSPDGRYYYIYYPAASLAIHSAEDDRLLREVDVTNDLPAQVLGWMYDSSGVLYRTPAGMLDSWPHPIYKLKVPE